MAVETPRLLQTKKYSAKAWRALFLDSAIQSGVLGATDLVVNWSGAGMVLAVASGAAWIKGTSSARQGVYDLYNDATINLTIAGNASGNPRVDQIVARVYDSTDGASGQDTGTVEVVQGTATAGATLANRTGAAALPAHSILLADVLVANGAVAMANTVIRDRRPWARGAYKRIVRSAGNYTFGTTAGAAVDATNLSPRFECTGNPIRVTVAGQWTHTATGVQVALELRLDGASSGHQINDSIATAANAQPFCATFDFVPAAGSHLFAPYAINPSGTLTIAANGTSGLSMVVEELVRQNVGNNEITSG